MKTSMERKHYYAYNKTREAFLSLGISLVDPMGGSSWAVLSRRELRTNEGIWLSCTKTRRDAAGYSGVCDRIYLDSALRVVALSEGLPGTSVDSSIQLFDSLLLLPVHTIFGSQTQVGDQVLIGTIEDIGAILDGIEPIVGEPLAGEMKGERRTMQSPMKWLARLFSARDRRRAARYASPPLMAFYWDGGIPIPHSVPDISKTGLFVKTADRWHPRTLLRVTLQKRADDPVETDETITLQCRVVRTGDDGVGMAFMVADGVYANGHPGVGRLATRKDLNHFLSGLASEADGYPSIDHPYLPFPELGQPPSSNGASGIAMSPEHAEYGSEHNSHAS